MNIDANSHTLSDVKPAAYTAGRTAVDFMRAPGERLRKDQEIRVTNNVQQVVGGIASLARTGDIGEAQSAAAERWYRDYVMGVVGARDPESRSSGRAPDLHASMLARTAAIGRCRTVRQGLGLCGEIRLKLMLIDELSFSAIATRIFPGDVNGRKKVAAQMSFLLEQLTELYSAMDRLRSGKTVRQRQCEGAIV